MSINKIDDFFYCTYEFYKFVHMVLNDDKTTLFVVHGLTGDKLF